jgi:hypothetical protein
MLAGNSSHLRRNGKISSCEPCRTSKVRCDHKTPRCDRCRLRGIESQCVYHPAPLTKSFKAPTTVRRTRNSLTTAIPQQRQISLPVPESETPMTAAETQTNDGEFLGSTSYSAVIADDTEIVDKHTGLISFRERVIELGSTTSVTSIFSISEDRIAAGKAVLQLLIDHLGHGINFDVILEQSFARILPAPFFRLSLASVKSTLDGLKFENSNDPLRDLVVKVFQDTFKPMKLFTTVPAKEYYKTFTGENLRWEFIGLLLTLAGISLKYEPGENLILIGDGVSVTRKDFKAQLLEASSMCITFCEPCKAVNYTALWLLLENAKLSTLVYGDMSEYVNFIQDQLY